MVSCSAVGCNSRSKTKKNQEAESVSFFSLPKDNNLRKIWVSKIKRDDLPKDTRICHLHFTEDSFQRDLKVSTVAYSHNKHCAMEWFLLHKLLQLLILRMSCLVYLPEEF